MTPPKDGKKKRSKQEIQKIRAGFEDSLKEINSFLDQWLEFHKAYKRAYKGEEFGREDEARFLDMKSNLARQHARLTLRLDRDYVGWQSIRPLLSQTVNLAQMSRLRPEHYDKIERSWHETYIHLNESIGHLRYVIESEG